MLNTIRKILSSTFRRGVPALPEYEKWPIRFLLASEELEALQAILNHIKIDPKRAEVEILATGLSGMVLYRLWQHGFYENEGWDKNAKCLKALSADKECSEISKCEERSEEQDIETAHHSPLTAYANVVAKVVPTLEHHRLKDINNVVRRNLALQELEEWVVSWNEEKYGADKSKWIKPIIIKGTVTSKLYYPDESLRPSLDIDVVMPKNMILDLFDKDEVLTWDLHDVGKKQWKGLIIEVHWMVTRLPENWGMYEQLLKSTVKCPFSEVFVIPDEQTIKHILAVHLTTHFGLSFNDLIDYKFINGELNTDLVSNSDNLQKFYFQYYFFSKMATISGAKFLDATQEEIWRKLSLKQKFFLKILTLNVFDPDNKILTALVQKNSWSLPLGKAIQRFFSKDKTK